MSDHVRPHDIVVYGASGFVGALTARYLAGHAPAGTRVALAGRSEDRLAAVRDQLGVDWPLLVADATDGDALSRMAVSARVVLSTVGPYLRYGQTLAHACADAGTDYVDLTGEVIFHRQSIDANHELARETGARIVHSCGFDSIPSDIGVYVLAQRVAADGEGELTDTTMVVTKLSGGFSGGTIDTIRNLLDEMKKDRRSRRIAANPYSLSPDRDKEPPTGRQSEISTVRADEVDPSLRGTLAPFLMAVYNTRVVRRSNALSDYRYGRGFRYRELASVGTSPLSPLLANGVKLGIGVMAAGLTLPPTRFVLDRVLPKPGTGPSEKVQREGHFTVDFYTTTTTGARYTARFRAQGDPGYAATAIMVGESALALVHDREALPPSEGGVLTPATGIGDALVTRLRAAGVEITARRL